MQYEYRKPHRRFFGPVHWGHCLIFHCKPNRIEELEAFMNEVAGSDLWRFNIQVDFSLFEFDDISDNPCRSILRFYDKEYTMRVKLMWHPCEPPAYSKSFYLYFGKVMPNIIAQNIIGVAPMTAPTAAIYTLRSRHGV